MTGTQGPDDSTKLIDLKVEPRAILLGTVLGVIAGFVANGLIVAADALSNGDGTRSLWAAAIALVLGASALARIQTYYMLAREIKYSPPQFWLDLALIAAASFSLGHANRTGFATRPFWIATLVVGVVLLIRNLYLHLKDYHRSVGTAFLALGSVAVLALWLGWLGGPGWLLAVGGLISAMAITEVYIETRWLLAA